jgi:hypothetical protein
MMKIKKALIFDSGAIITLALNDLLGILEPLKWAFGGEFYITDPVKMEIVDTPLKTRRFALEAMMIKTVIDKKILKVVSDPEMKKETARILGIANTTYQAENENMRIIHEGEASCLALYNLIEAEKKAVVIDERTTRMLCESPENLHRLFESKLHRKIVAINKNFEMFKKIKVIRTSELCWIAYKKRIISLPALPPEAIRALLYAVKYKGCAISINEIEIARRLK